jgi:hypothetical protein
LSTRGFTPREAAAILLVDRIVIDPHSVDDLFAELREHFGDEEIIEPPREEFLHLGRNSEHGCSPRYGSRWRIIARNSPARLRPFRRRRE